MHYETAVEIQAPMERVWAVTTDVEGWPAWTASVLSVDRLDGGPFLLGSRVAICQPKSPRAVWTVTALEPGRAFTWESRATGVRTVATHRLKALPSGGTSVTLTVDATGLLAFLLGPLLRGTVRRLVEMEAEGLRRRCEGHGEASQAPHGAV